MDGARLISNILNSIDAGDSERLRLLLRALPISRMSTPGYNRLVATLLKKAEEFEADDSVREVYTFLVSNNIEENRLSVVGQIFRNNIIEVPTVVYFTGVINATYVRVFEDLAKYDSDGLAPASFELLDRVYGQQTLDIYKSAWQFIADQIEEQYGRNEYADKYLQRHIKELEKYAPYPAWVQPYFDPSDDIDISRLSNNDIKKIIEPAELESRTLPSDEYLDNLPYHEDLIKTIPDPPEFDMARLPTADVAAGILTVGLKAMGLSYEESKQNEEQLKRNYQMSTPDEKYIMIKDFLKTEGRYSLRYDRYIFRLFGPLNPLFGSNLDEDGPCAIYGGCRMLTCYEYENIDKETGEIIEPDINDNHNYNAIDWYSGTCDLCLLRIRRRHHAVRMPLPDGGWVGCYCSWECVRRDVPDQNDLVRFSIINRFDAQIRANRIYDRQYNYYDFTSFIGVMTPSFQELYG